MPLNPETSNSPPKLGFDLPSFQEHVHAFLQNGSHRNLSPRTLDYYSFHLLGLHRYLSARDDALDHPSFSLHVGHMLNDMAAQGRARRTMRGRYHTCRLFFQFLFPEHPWLSMEIPAARNDDKKLTKYSAFNDCQLECLLQQPDLRTFTGYRDYTIMLVLLDTGIRLSELCSLKVSDIDIQDQTIRITLGKGQKSRYVPFQNICVEHLKTYLQFRGAPAHEQLWITRRKTPLCRGTIIKILRHYSHKAKLIDVRGSAHTFRHTMAKKFLLNGGSVYVLQHILGHSALEVTRHYVNLLQVDLHNQHEKWSPVESLLAYANKKNIREENALWK